MYNCNLIEHLQFPNLSQSLRISKAFSQSQLPRVQGAVSWVGECCVQAGVLICHGLNTCAKRLLSRPQLFDF
jgi:hypothetical protein